MKKISCFALLSLLTVALLVLSGCSLFSPQNQPEILKTYPNDVAPSQAVKTESRWVMLHSTYGDSNYSISVGESLDSAKDIYSTCDVSIWYFEANENAIVWCESSSEFYTYKTYTFETQELETVFQLAKNDKYQPQNIGIHLNTVYYSTIDYESQEVRVIAYDITTKIRTDIIKAEFDETKQPYSINIENEYLSFACSDRVKVLDLRDDEVVFESSLPETVKYVFTVSYDSINDTCALYYADENSEDIGILKEGDSSIASVFTFSKNRYAYQDKIECYDGHIYWIAQANVSGNITDHYRLIDYNYLEHKPIETKRTFNYYRFEDTVYILRFNKGGKFTHIDLCQY